MRDVAQRRQDRRPSPRCPRCGIAIHASLKWAWEAAKKVKAGQLYWLAEHQRWHEARA